MSGMDQVWTDVWPGSIHNHRFIEALLITQFPRSSVCIAHHHTNEYKCTKSMAGSAVQVLMELTLMGAPFLLDQPDLPPFNARIRPERQEPGQANNSFLSQLVHRVIHWYIKTLNDGISRSNWLEGSPNSAKFLLDSRHRTLRFVMSQGPRSIQLLIRCCTFISTLVVGGK